jgi:hypothetical protein
MPRIHGRITPKIDDSKITRGWHERRNSALAPAAELRTDGESFEIEYDKIWSVDSLKHDFDLEVQRVQLGAQIVWL